MVAQQALTQFPSAGTVFALRNSKLLVMEANEYRPRPKSDYMMSAPWQELYKLTEHWLKDLSFYADELRFFEKLLSAFSYFPNPNIAKANDLVKDASTQLKNITTQIEEHQKHIAQLIKSTSIDNEDYVFRQEHNLLEDTITAFIDSYRQLKSQLYSEAQKFIPDSEITGVE